MKNIAPVLLGIVVILFAANTIRENISPMLSFMAVVAIYFVVRTLYARLSGELPTEEGETESE